MKLLRISWRFLFFVAYTASIVVTIYNRKVVLKKDIHDAMRIRRRWARRLLRGVGVLIESSGEVIDQPCLLVCNHRSYLDPIIILAFQDAFPVAKAELANWPLLGKGARLAGILYLRRESANSRASILREIASAIEAGHQVLLFPEGTTSGIVDGLLPFKKGGFRAAAEHRLAVSPVALCFASPEDFWVGEEGFLEHAYRRFQEKTIRVKVHFGPVYRDADASVLHDNCKNWIEQRLAAHRNRH